MMLVQEVLKILLEDLTLSQIGISDQKGLTINHISDQHLPQHIKFSTNIIFKLRKNPKFLRIHSSSEKEAEEESFAEMQLFPMAKG